MHDFNAGVTIGGITFRIVDFAPNTWQTSEDQRMRTHGAGIEDDLTPQTIERIIEAKPEGVTWEVMASDTLRDQLREVVEGLEAKQRSEREPADEKPDAERLTFSGVVTLADDDGAPHVGGEEVLRKVAEKFGRGEPLVEVYLGAEREPATTMAGPIEADEGWPGTDVTPGEVPKIEVGGYDLLTDLRKLEGRHVELVVREVERPPSFFVEVDPRIEDETWKVEDARWSPAARRDPDLTGEKLVELIDRGLTSIVVSFLSGPAVYRAIDEYHRIERDQGRVLPLIEVVPGKGEPAYTVGESVEMTTDPIPHFVAGVARTGFGLAGMDTPQELHSAQRALEAHRDGKLVVVIDPAVAEVLDEKTGPPTAPSIGLAHPDELAWKALQAGIAEARAAKDVKAEGTDPPDDEPAEFIESAKEPIGEAEVAGEDEHGVHIHDGDELSVWVDGEIPAGQWKVGPLGSPYLSKQGGFTTDRLRALIHTAGKHPLVVQVSTELMPNMMVALISLGEVRDRSLALWVEDVTAKLAAGDTPAEPPQRSASERVVLAIRGAIKEVEADLRAANGEAFPQRGAALGIGMFAPPPSSAALNNAYERLIEALMWADKHEENVAAARRRFEGKTPAQIMAEQMQAAGLDLGAMGIGKRRGG